MRQLLLFITTYLTNGLICISDGKDALITLIMAIIRVNTSLLELKNKVDMGSANQQTSIKMDAARVAIIRQVYGSNGYNNIQLALLVVNI